MRYGLPQHGGLKIVTLLMWRMVSKRQKAELPGQLRATPGTGPASFSNGQNSHEDCPDLRR